MSTDTPWRGSSELRAGARLSRSFGRDERCKRRSLAVERLEGRELLAASAIPVVINVPVDINPKDVYLEVSALLTSPYTNNQKKTFGTNDVVYYDYTIADYNLAGPGGKFAFSLSESGHTLQLPTAQVSGGHIAIGIGNPPIVTYSTSGISTPTASTNPDNIFGLFEYSYSGNELDLDVSEIDQVGIPFTITTTPAGPIPAEDGVGISIARNVMFELYPDYIKSQGSAAALFEQSYDYGNPYRLLAPQNVISGDAATPDLNKAAWKSGGSLEIGHIYNYWMTAENEHGESAISNMQAFQPKLHPRFNVGYQTAVFTWEAFGGDPTKYNFYRGKSGDPTDARYIGSADPTDKFFEDAGRSLGADAPPTSGYTYNPLNQYFNNAIDAFFSQYTAKDSFQIERDGYLFTGEVGTYQENGHNYAVLDLSPTTGPYKDVSFLIFRPYFSDNTDIKGMPPAPTWMPHPHQTPAAMILASDGVFKSTGLNPDTHDQMLNDLENSINSAFNRGIADNFSIHPSNWANEPELNSATTIAPLNPHENNLKPNTTYHYVITAMYPDPSGDPHKPANETTISLERAAKTTADHRVIDLHWTAHNKPTMYNVYRTETPGQDYKLIDHVVNDISDPAKGYIDAGLRTPQNVSPPMYYAPGSTSNWYSAFFHQNSTNDSRNGVSINGLAYGFPYDDQGSQSTNFQGVFTQVDINLGRWKA